MIAFSGHSASDPFANIRLTYVSPARPTHVIELPRDRSELRAFYERSTSDSLGGDMARFFFHLHECGTVIEDEEGVERRPQEIREIAMQSARSVMSEEVSSGHLCVACCIVVEDSDHNEVMRVPFSDALTISGL